MFLVKISNNLTGKDAAVVSVIMRSIRAAEMLASRIQHYGGVMNTFSFDYVGRADRNTCSQYTFIVNNDMCIEFLFNRLYPK